MTNGQGFDEILDICLDRLQQGDTVEACLISYPAYAGRLAPVLQIAVALQVPEGPSMSARGFRAGQVRVLQRMARLRVERGMAPPVERESPLRRVLIGTQRLWAGTIAGILLFCMVLGAGAVTVSAASTSLPGSPLYSVKRVTENLVSSAAFTPRLKARAHLAWAERRLVEIGALISRDGVVYRTLLVGLQNETERALEAARQAGPEMLAALVALTERQQITLAEYLEQAPEFSRADLEQALAASAALQDQAEAALSGQVPGWPTNGLVASATFVLPGFTPTGEPSETVGGMETPTPTEPPGSIEPTSALGEPLSPTVPPVLPVASSTPAPSETPVVSLTPVERLTVTSEPTASPTGIPAVAPVSPWEPTSTNTVVPADTPVPNETSTPTEMPTPTETLTSVPIETPSPTVTQEFHGWDQSSLVFVDQGVLCDRGGTVWATVENRGKAMAGSAVWELWRASSGSPRSGEIIATGEIRLDAGQEDVIEAASQDPGNYMFKAYQRPGHPGQGLLWSDAIEFDPGQCDN